MKKGWIQLTPTPWPPHPVPRTRNRYCCLVRRQSSDKNHQPMPVEFVFLEAKHTNRPISGQNTSPFYERCRISELRTVPPQLLNKSLTLIPLGAPVPVLVLRSI
jgi:hypothetical protein